MWDAPWSWFIYFYLLFLPEYVTQRTVMSFKSLCMYVCSYAQTKEVYRFLLLLRKNIGQVRVGLPTDSSISIWAIHLNRTIWQTYFASVCIHFALINYNYKFVIIFIIRYLQFKVIFSIESLNKTDNFKFVSVCSRFIWNDCKCKFVIIFFLRNMYKFLLLAFLFIL